MQKFNLAESGPKIPVYIWFLDSAESTEKKCWSQRENEQKRQRWLDKKQPNSQGKPSNKK